MGIQRAGRQTDSADRTMRQKITTLRIRSIVALGLALALAILVPSLFTFEAGLNDARDVKDPPFRLRRPLSA